MATLKIPTDTSQATLGYLLADGSIALTADWDAGAFKITANEFRLNDDEPITFGTGAEATIKFTGGSLLITPGAGGAQVSGDFTATGDVAVGGTLEVTGSAAFTDTLDASGNVVFTSQLQVNGTADFRNTLTVSDRLTVNDDVQIAGIADAVQLIVRAHSTQTNDILLVEKSDGTDLFTINNAGVLTAFGGIASVGNNDFRAFYTEFDQITAPSNPSAGTRRLFVDSGTGELSVRTSGSSTVSLEALYTDAEAIAAVEGEATLDLTGDVLMKAHVAMGPSGLINASIVLNVVELKADSNLKGALFNPINTSSSGASRLTTGLAGFAVWQGSGTATGNICMGLDFEARHNSSRSIVSMIGVRAKTNSLASGSGTWTTSMAFNAAAISLSSAIPVTAVGMRIENQGHASETDCFGLQILAQTAAGGLTLPILVEDASGVGVLGTRIHNRIGADTYIGDSSSTPIGTVHIEQKESAGVKPVLILEQLDIDDTFVDYKGTSAADGSRSISSDTTEDSAKFGAVRCEINGVTKWIRIYDDES